MRLSLNGVDQELPDGASLTTAVAAGGVAAEARGVAVAVDGEVIPRARWEATTLREGQRVEILQAVGGG